VGINNSSPVEMLTIGSTSDTNVRVQFLSSTTGANTIQFGDGTGASAYSGYINYTHSDNALAFATNGSERMRIDSSGNVGIGIASPAQILHIKSAAPDIRIEDSDGGYVDLNAPGGSLELRADQGNAVGSSKISFWVDATERMRIDSSGNLLVGTTSTPSATQSGFMFSSDQLYTSAGAATTTNYQVRFYNGNGLVGAITTDGSATAYLTSSDQRLKENIADANDAGSKIDSIQVRKFDWKADGSHQDYGMVAQELLEVAPEAVSVPEDSEEMMGVDYSKLVPMMLKEIQSLRARVAQLES